MEKIYANRWLGTEERPVGCGFYLLHAGLMRTGRVLRFGHYNCWHVVVAGSGFVQCLNHKFSLQRGDMFSVMYDSEIIYGPAPGTADWEFAYLRVEGERAAELTARIGLLAEHPVRLQVGEAVLRQFLALQNPAALPRESPEYDAAAILRIVDTLEKPRPPQKRTEAQLVQEAQQLLADPYHARLNIKEISAMLGVSRVTLFKAFRQATGKSPLEFLQRHRLQQCLQYLRENPGATAGDLREHSAFPNGKSFFRAFKRWTGATPGAYLRAVTPPKPHFPADVP